MYLSCLLLIAPRRRSRIYTTESNGDMPSSIKAIATNTGALLLKTNAKINRNLEFLLPIGASF
jgi:hypothetical protein